MYPVPDDEAERLEFLSDCGLTGSPAEREFDEIAHLAADLCDAPIALVTIITKDNQRLHGRTGVAIDSTSRDISFCAHAITSDAPFIVRDAATDPRFAHNALVIRRPVHSLLCRRADHHT
ncbi:hypothetical protein [uncultured Sphingomonas sp.]|uniref:hypothetical protein n=1 Tax=uncultured Sphingomonas sp. TaxID=158754 RepID=UPI0035CBEADB